MSLILPQRRTFSFLGKGFQVMSAFDCSDFGVITSYPEKLMQMEYEDIQIGELDLINVKMAKLTDSGLPFASFEIITKSLDY